MSRAHLRVVSGLDIVQNRQQRRYVKDRLFNGKLYTSMFSSTSKSQVDELAQRMKNEGYLVRVLKSKVGKYNHYDLYARKK